MATQSAAYVVSIVAGGLATLGSFVAQAMIIRAFGMSAYGEFAAWRNNSHLAGAVGTLSLNMVIVKHIPKEISTASPRSTVHRIVAVSLLLATLFTLVLSSIIHIMQPKGLYPIYAGTALALCWISIAGATGRSLGNAAIAATMERALYPLLFLLVLALMSMSTYSSSQLQGFFLIACSLALGASAIVALSGFKRLPVDVMDTGPRYSVGWILVTALPFFAVTIGSIISARAPLLIAQYTLSDSSLGRCALMFVMAGLINIPLFSINLIAGPRIADAHARGSLDDAVATIRTTTLISAALGSSIAVALWLSKDAMKVMLDRPHCIQDSAFAILLASATLSAVTTAPSLFMQMTNRQKRLAVILNASVAAKVALVAPATLLYDEVGFAIAEFIQSLMYGAWVSITYRGVTRSASDSDTF